MLVSTQQSRRRRSSDGDPFHVSRIHEALAASGYAERFPPREGQQNAPLPSSSPHTVGSFFHSVPIRTSSQAQVCRGRRRRRKLRRTLPSLSLSLLFFERKNISLSLPRTEPDDAMSKSGARTNGKRERERVRDQVSSVKKKKSHCTGASDRGVGR